MAKASKIGAVGLGVAAFAVLVAGCTTQVSDKGTAEHTGTSSEALSSTSGCLDSATLLGPTAWSQIWANSNATEQSLETELQQWGCLTSTPWQITGATTGGRTWYAVECPWWVHYEAAFQNWTPNNNYDTWAVQQIPGFPLGCGGELWGTSFWNPWSGWVNYYPVVFDPHGSTN